VQPKIRHEHGAFRHQLERATNELPHDRARLTRRHRITVEFVHDLLSDCLKD
jgi:hypothetical protein